MLLRACFTPSAIIELVSGLDGVAPASAVPVGSYVAFAVALVLRVAAVAWDWKLPVWLANGEARTRGSWFSSRRQTFYFERPAGESDEANKS